MQNNYKLMRESFFNSYKSFIDIIQLSNTQNNLYNILILKKQLQNNLTKINIVIRSNHNNDEIYHHELSSNMVLNKEEANILIEDIRKDFIENHYITYSSVNPKTLIHSMQNKILSLNIKLTNIEEYTSAINFNNEINNKNKQRVLTKS